MGDFRTPPQSPSSSRTLSCSTPTSIRLDCHSPPLVSRADCNTPPPAPKVGRRTVKDDLVDSLPLHIAVEFDIEVCKAVERGDLCLLESAVEHGAAKSFDRPTRYKQELVSPIEIALRKMNSSSSATYRRITDFMLQHGANPDALVSRGDAEGQTLLHLVASSLSTEAVLLLLEHDANPNSLDDKGRSPLHAVSVSLQSWSFLSHKCDAISEALLAAGADPTKKDAYGFTPQDYVNQSASAMNWHTSTPIQPLLAMDIVWLLHQDGDLTRCPSEASDCCSEASDSD